MPPRLLLQIFQQLYAQYGPQHWWPAESRWEMILGAILTQSAAWSNVERALENLKGAGVFSPEALRRATHDELARLLRPAVYFNAKARKVKAFAEHLARYGDDLDALLAKGVGELRQELLGIYGIGEETADDILLYAAHRPVFVIDAYTRRIFQRLRRAPQRQSYAAYQELFHQGLPPDPQLYNEYHALLDRHGVKVCQPQPLCHGCCLLELCPTGREAVQGGVLKTPERRAGKLAKNRGPGA